MRHALSGGPDSEAVLTHFVGEMSEDDLTRLQQVLARRAQESSTQRPGEAPTERSEGER